MTASFPHRLRFAIAPFLVAAALAITGCGKSGGSGDSVSGKVLLGDKAVSGEVVFVGSDKKESASPIGPDGSYKVVNAPKGEVTILVRSMGTPVAAPKGSDAKGMPGVAAGGVAPPAKYATAAGGLKVTVTGGDQKHDITLTP